MRIAVDAMGGDHAPKAVVQGALAAAKDWNDIEIILVGDERQIAPWIKEKPGNLSIIHTEVVIASDEEPVRAVRKKKNASMVLAAQLVRDGQADAILSAGNTGALMASGLLIIGRIEGIERPALTATFPTVDGKGVLVLDVGANMDATPEQLMQYAMMGNIFSSQVRGNDRPRIGLLNVGTEASKGNELTKNVYPLMEAASFDFVGNIEARDILEGVCDVLICDGFVGNIMLKAVEGTAGTVFKQLKSVFMNNLPSKLAALVLKPGLSRLKSSMDYAEKGGAPLLGIDGVVIKGHGSSNEIAIKNAIREARITVKNELVALIKKEISGGVEGS